MKCCRCAKYYNIAIEIAIANCKHDTENTEN